MDVSRIIAEIDSQISKLQQARELISGSVDVPLKTGAKRGRPKGSKNAVVKTPGKTASKAVDKPAVKPAPAAAGKTGRKLSPEGRKRIADAMKKRWADRKKLAVK